MERFHIHTIIYLCTGVGMLIQYTYVINRKGCDTTLVVFLVKVSTCILL